MRRHLEEDPVDDEAEADHEERVEGVHGAGVGVDVEARGPGVAGEDAEEGHKGHVELAEVGRAPLGEEVDPDDGVCAAARDSGPCDPGLRPGRIDSERVRVSRRWRQRARARRSRVRPLRLCRAGPIVRFAGRIERVPVSNVSDRHSHGSARPLSSRVKI